MTLRHRDACKKNTFIKGPEELLVGTWFLKPGTNCSSEICEKNPRLSDGIFLEYQLKVNHEFEIILLVFKANKKIASITGNTGRPHF